MNKHDADFHAPGKFGLGEDRGLHTTKQRVGVDVTLRGRDGAEQRLGTTNLVASHRRTSFLSSNAPAIDFPVMESETWSCRCVA